MRLSFPKTTWILIFALMSMFVLGLSDNIRGPLFPELLRYFQLSNAQGSLSFAFASFASLMGNTVSAYAIRKISLNHLLAFSMLVMMLGMLAMGLAPDFNSYLISALIFGFSMGSTAVAQNLLIAENIHAPLQTKALAALHSVYGLSSLAAPFLASRSPRWFESHTDAVFLSQWQSSFFVTSFIALIVLVLILFSKPETNFVRLAEVTKSKRPGLLKSIPTKLWFAGFFASYVGAEILVSTRLALYMRTYFNFTLEQSSNYVTYFFIFLLAGRLLFAIKSFKVPIKNQLNIFLVSSVVCYILGLWVHPFFLTLLGFTMAPYYPLAIVYISERTGLQKRSFLTFVMGIQGAVVISMHVGVGYVTDAFSLFYAFLIGIILLAVSLLCLNLHPEIVSED